MTALRRDDLLQKFGLAHFIQHILVRFPLLLCRIAAFLCDSAGHIVIVC
jgi:hypothetical protein